MLLRLPSDDTPTPKQYHGLRWRRGLVVDVDPEHGPALKLAGAVEITSEEAAEVVIDPGAEPPAPEPTDDERRAAATAALTGVPVEPISTEKPAEEPAFIEPPSETPRRNRDRG